MAIINARRPNAGEAFNTFGTSGDDLINGSTGNDYIFAGAGNDTVYAGDGNDYVFAGTGADTVYGGAGNDYLDAGARRVAGVTSGDGARDLLVGGIGDDTYNVMEALDSVVELAGEGTDTVIAYRINYTLGANLENLQLSSWAQDRLVGRGNELNNTIFGGLGADTIYGMDGDDTIVTTSFDGNDLYVGGRGNDTYSFGMLRGRDVIDNAADDNASTVDRLLWTSTDYVDHIWFKRAGDDLVMQARETTSGSYLLSSQWGRIDGVATEVTVKNWYTNPTARIDQFVNDMTKRVLVEADVQALVDAMAGYDAKKAAGTATAADLSAVHALIAASWK
jgi:Ca2+-binding RTX toxin-like protein